jgi:hypothetical protein
VIFTGLVEQMHNYWLRHYFPEMMARSIEKMPSEHQIRAALARSGFTDIRVSPYFVTNELQDLFLYSGKHRPDLYLDPIVRDNISSFANLAPDSELKKGLYRLASDIDSGTVSSVMAKYRAGAGDYAYITARADAPLQGLPQVSRA